MNKARKLCILLPLMLLLTGCWDLIEINDRIFVSAVGIDLYKGKENGKYEHRSPSEENDLMLQDRFVITYSAPNLKAIGKNATSNKPRIIMASISNNAYETTKELATRTNRNLSFRHLKAYIIGEDVARNSDYMKEIFDDVDRHELLSRKLSFLIAKGTAKEIIDIEDPFEPLTGQLIDGILKKKQGSARYNTEVFNDILTDLYFDGDALIPRVVAGEGEVKVAGSAVIKDYKLVGWLGEMENIAAMYFLDRVNAVLINVKYKDINVPYEIKSNKTKYDVKVENGKVKYIVNINTEGDISVFKLTTKEKAFDDKTIKEIEKLVENALKKQILDIVTKLQKEFKVDVIRVSDYISKHKPDLWDQVKDDWDNIFSNIDIEVNVDVKTRRVGMTK